MTEQTTQIALALEPQSETLAAIPLIKALVEHRVSESLVEANKLALNLMDISPQVVWVTVDQIDAFKETMMGLLIETRVVTKEEADRISTENVPIRGTIDLRIRSRGDLNDLMIKGLKEQKLISGYRKGEDANGIYHWKDDRWYQDWNLVIFNKTDITKIESIINGYGYSLIKPYTHEVLKPESNG